MLRKINKILIGLLLIIIYSEPLQTQWWFTWNKSKMDLYEWYAYLPLLSDIRASAFTFGAVFITRKGWPSGKAPNYRWDTAPYDQPLIDFSIGTEMPIIGYKNRENFTRRGGWGFGIFYPVSMHVLTDYFDAQASNPIINVDYQFVIPPYIKS